MHSFERSTGCSCDVVSLRISETHQKTHLITVDNYTLIRASIIILVDFQFDSRVDQ